MSIKLDSIGICYAVDLKVDGYDIFVVADLQVR